MAKLEYFLPEGKKYHVAIAVPTYRLVPARTVRFLVDLVGWTLNNRPDILLSFLWRDEFPVAGCVHCYEEGQEMDDARNYFAKQALEQGCTHLLMVDSDMDRSKDGDGSWLARLVDHKVDIVAPLFMRRSQPFDLLARYFDKDTGEYTSIPADKALSGALIPIDAVGFGAILIDMRVFAEIKFPWFAFQFRHGTLQSEDSNFCRKAKQKGFKIWCDTGIHIDHLGEHRYRPIEAINIARQREEDVEEIKEATHGLVTRPNT